jgi:hypothetical protein
MVGIMSQVFSLVVLLLILFPLHETFHLHTGWFGIYGCFSHLCFLYIVLWISYGQGFLYLQ